jgi:hypothetical protein
MVKLEVYTLEYTEEFESIEEAEDECERLERVMNKMCFIR